MRTPFSICVETVVGIAIAASNHNLYFICTQDLFFLHVLWIAENKYFKYRILQIDDSRNEKHVKDRTCSKNSMQNETIVLRKEMVVKNNLVKIAYYPTVSYIHF